MRPNFPRLTFLIPVFVLLLVSFTACRKENKDVPKEAARYNVLLVSIDTLRADYLKLYNTNGVDTPELNRLASEGVVFEKAISQVPYTLPSHVTMLTGLYPTAHGVRDNVRDLLPEKVSTIAELFRKNGYETAGFAGSMVLSRHTGLDRGFDYYDDSFSRADVHAEDLGAIERSAEDVFHSFDYWFQKKRSARNFFAFLHFYDPHSPYQPPGKFAPKSNEVSELYKGEIRYVDSVLGQLFTSLRQSGFWQETVVMITSDHGELLGEHEETGHGFFLYQPSLHVPLIVHDPGLSKNIRIKEIVELVDIPPTLLDYAKIQTLPGFQGESLYPLARGTGQRKKRTAFSETYFASLQFGVSPQSSIQDNRYKYIDSPQPELYDLSRDSAETKNLSETQKDLASKFRQGLQQFKAATETPEKKSEQRSVSAEEAEQFAALGYLGGNVPESSWDRTKDPKEFIDLWNESLKTTFLMGSHQFQAALPLIQKLQKATAGHSTPSLLVLEAKCYAGLGQIAKAEAILKPLGNAPEAKTTLAQIYSSTGKTELAEEAYRQVLKDNYSHFVLYNYLLLLKKTGRKDEALALLNKTRKEQPDTEQSRSFFAESYFMLGDLQESEKLCVNFIENRPWELKWYLQLAGIYQLRGEVQRGLSLLTSNNQHFVEKPDYWWRLGILYKAAGNYPREVEAFQKMLKLSPQDSRGYFYLAKAMVDQRQNIPGVIQLAEVGLRLRPDVSMQIFGHYILAEAYQYSGRIPEAKQQMEIAQRLEKIYG